MNETLNDCNLQKEIFSRIDMLAEKMGTTAENIYPLLVQEQVAIGTASLVVGGFLIIAFCVCACICIMSLKRGNEDDWHDGTNVALSIIPGIAGIFLFTFGSSHVYTGILLLIAPEAVAIRTMLQVISG